MRNIEASFHKNRQRYLKIIHRLLRVAQLLANVKASASIKTETGVPENNRQKTRGITSYKCITSYVRKQQML